MVQVKRFDDTQDRKKITPFQFYLLSERFFILYAF